jgi:hypothetical protein
MMAKKKVDLDKLVRIKTKNQRRNKPKHLRHSKSLNKHDPDKKRRG